MLSSSGMLMMLKASMVSLNRSLSCWPGMVTFPFDRNRYLLKSSSNRSAEHKKKKREVRSSVKLQRNEPETVSHKLHLGCRAALLQEHDGCCSFVHLQLSCIQTGLCFFCLFVCERFHSSGSVSRELDVTESCCGDEDLNRKPQRSKRGNEAREKHQQRLKRTSSER